MWKPKVKLDFLGLHYIFIVSCALLSFVVMYAYGNLRAVDAFFFGCSGSTESGLNTVDVTDLKIYQQLVIYFIPTITNLGFINIIVVVVRLYWFNKRLKHTAPSLLQSRNQQDVEANGTAATGSRESKTSVAQDIKEVENPSSIKSLPLPQSKNDDEKVENDNTAEKTAEHGETKAPNDSFPRSVTWAEGVSNQSEGKALRIPPPRDRDKGMPMEEVDAEASDDEDEDKISVVKEATGSSSAQQHTSRFSSAVSNISVERIASSVFVVGDSRARARSQSPHRSTRTRSQSPRRSTSQTQPDLPSLSAQVTVGRNSTFHNMTTQDWENLGGIEYRSLKLLLKVILSYFFGLHILGVICLVPWIHNAPAKYQNYLDAQGQNDTWWAFYSAQTMVNNLGFTLTPDSMLHFADATWPMLIMTFLAYAGETFYPIFLRLIIWTMFKISPENSSRRESLRFLLDHPRRCYTLLFPSSPTWILFGILVGLNFVDVLLIVLLDLDNPAVNFLAPGPRILAALFQSASARHTGTAVFNLADVNPAVQFSLLVMMYISIFPIAMSIRMSNTYEYRSLGKYGKGSQPHDDQAPSSYLLNHIRQQLSFDLWWILLGTFCICIAESGRIADSNDPAFSVFAMMFEVTSGYANVGLSLGHPTVLTSLSGKFKIFSKLVICFMMIRGRHRGLPYAVDRAIVLPGEDLVDEGAREDKED